MSDNPQDWREVPPYASALTREYSAQSVQTFVKHEISAGTMPRKAPWRSWTDFIREHAESAITTAGRAGWGAPVNPACLLRSQARVSGRWLRCADSSIFRASQMQF